MELNKEVEIKVLNCVIMSWFCFNHLNTPPLLFGEVK
jgi:LytS/YehU family sensor histidine kinase